MSDNGCGKAVQIMAFRLILKELREELKHKHCCSCNGFRSTWLLGTSVLCTKFDFSLGNTFPAQEHIFFRLCAQQRCSSEGFGDGLRGGSSRLVVVAVPWQVRGGEAAAEQVTAGS